MVCGGCKDGHGWSPVKIQGNDISGNGYGFRYSSLAVDPVIRPRAPGRPDLRISSDLQVWQWSSTCTGTLILVSLVATTSACTSHLAKAMLGEAADTIIRCWIVDF